MSTKIQINTQSPITAYVEESKKLSNVGIVIAHDVFGIDDDIRSRMDYWSSMGYTVVAPDLFSSEGAVSPLTVEDVDNLDKHRALCADFNVERGLEGIQAAIAFARGRGCDGVGVLGFGLGGLLAWLAAAKGDSEASISYCAPAIEDHLKVAGSIETPVSIYMAAEDDLVSKEAQQRIGEKLAKHRQVRVFTHPYVSHGFARWDSRKRDRCALTLAEHRAGEFFYMNLALKHWQARPTETVSA